MRRQETIVKGFEVAAIALLQALLILTVAIATVILFVLFATVVRTNATGSPT